MPLPVHDDTALATLARLDGRVAVVTGAARGIGFASARRLIEAGATVVLADVDGAALTEAATRLGPRAIAASLDVTDEQAVTRLFADVRADILVNNAGIQFVSPIEDFPVDQYDRIVALNMSAAFHLTRMVVPMMKARKWGRILSTASAHSLVASANKSAYVMTKHGIAGLTKAIALELATTGVTVNCISPGYVWTTLVENQIPDTMKARGLTREQVMNDVLLAAQPTKRFVTPQEVAAMALFLCRDEAGSITGANMSVDGGWTAQ